MNTKRKNTGRGYGKRPNSALKLLAAAATQGLYWQQKRVNR